MVHLSVIEAQLSRLGIRISRWFRPEIHELQLMMMDNEKIIALACGRYFGGLAILVATDQRLLLIDKKTFFMTSEDIRYDMISEVDFNSRVLDSTISIFTVNKQHRFTTIRYKHHLRRLTNYVQQRIMELRHFQQQLPVTNKLEQSPQLPQVVGTAAIQDSSWVNTNPYAKDSFVARTQWSRTNDQLKH